MNNAWPREDDEGTSANPWQQRWTDTQEFQAMQGMDTVDMCGFKFWFYYYSQEGELDRWTEAKVERML